MKTNLITKAIFATAAYIFSSTVSPLLAQEADDSQPEYVAGQVNAKTKIKNKNKAKSELKELNMMGFANTSSTNENSPKEDEDIYFSADEMINDDENQTITAVGNVNIMKKNTVVIADKVTYNLADQKADISIGRTFVADGSQDVVFTALTSTTPNATNDINPPMPKHEKMRQADPHGFTMTITAVAVVFSALILLYFAFWALGKIMIRIAKRNKQKAAGVSVAPTEKKKDDGAIVGAEIAAIGMALKMYQDEMHDIESHVLTINRVAKAYSPWSSKIYGLTQPLHK